MVLVFITLIRYGYIPNNTFLGFVYTKLLFSRIYIIFVGLGEEEYKKKKGNFWVKYMYMYLNVHNWYHIKFIQTFVSYQIALD